MTSFRGAGTAALSLLLLAGCARGTADGSVASGTEVSATASAGASPTEPSAAGRDGDEPVLQIRQSGGFLTPAMLLSRLQLVSVYADGRMVTSAPQTLEYPGAAMATLQVHRLKPAAVDALVVRAVDAGVRSGTDFGRPNVADAPSTRFTVRAPSGRQGVEVLALGEARSDDPQLTPAQNTARAELAGFLSEVTALPDRLGPPQPYRPTAIAAIARPFTAEGDAEGDPAVRVPPPRPWPGPALPGETLAEGIGLGCVTVSGDQVGRLLEAVRTAKANTPWTSGGRKWTVTFRQMLPDETGCADLKAER
jgi:hypothetical protein